MKKQDYFINNIVNILFCIAITTCCMVMIYALVIFISDCTYLKNTITDLANGYDKVWDVQVTSSDIIDADIGENAIETDDSDNIGYDKLSQINYMNSLVDYIMKLQELEAKATSTNIMTFIYTFLSGALIGVATYFTKKSSDSIRQIKENKELITDLDSRTLFANFYMHAQRTYSTMQIFVLSLDSIQDDSILSGFIDRYVPKINDFMQEMAQFAKVNRENVCKMNSEDQRRILEEINGIGNLIHYIHSRNDNDLLSNQNNGAKNIWEYQLRQVKKVLKP